MKIAMMVALSLFASACTETEAGPPATSGTRSVSEDAGIFGAWQVLGFDDGDVQYDTQVVFKDDSATFFHQCTFADGTVFEVLVAVQMESDDKQIRLTSSGSASQSDGDRVCDFDVEKSDLDYLLSDGDLFIGEEGEYLRLQRLDDFDEEPDTSRPN